MAKNAITNETDIANVQERNTLEVSVDNNDSTPDIIANIEPIKAIDSESDQQKERLKLTKKESDAIVGDVNDANDSDRHVSVIDSQHEHKSKNSNWLNPSQVPIDRNEIDSIANEKFLSEIDDEFLSDYPEREYSLHGDDDEEMKYFIYKVKDINYVPKKECVGKIVVPKGSQGQRSNVTLEEFRKLIRQSSDEMLRDAARQRFKYLAESYHLVATNESDTSIHQIYPAQGVFIKLDSEPYPWRRGIDTSLTAKLQAEYERKFGPIGPRLNRRRTSRLAGIREENVNQGGINQIADINNNNDDNDDGAAQRDIWDPKRIIRLQENRRKSRVAPISSSMNVYRSQSIVGQENQIRGYRKRYPYSRPKQTKYDWFRSKQMSEVKKFDNPIPNYPRGERKLFFC